MKLHPKTGIIVFLVLVILSLFAVIAWDARTKHINGDPARKNDCIRELADRLDAQQLVGTPSANIADCLQFAAKKKELENGKTSYVFQHPTRSNQEGPADIGIIVDSKSKTIVRAELLYYDW